MCVFHLIIILIIHSHFSTFLLKIKLQGICVRLWMQGRPDIKFFVPTVTRIK